MRHSHGIHCLHVYGWDIRRWCGVCHNHWEGHCGQAGCKKYATLADELLVRGVLLSMESGALPLDPMMLAIDLSDLGVSQPSREPSAN
jgi:hypothetical protein